MLKETKYQVTISYTFCGIKTSLVFCKPVTSFDDLKQQFLKRFGDINSAPNKTLREKPLVKKLTYAATDIDEWVETVNLQTRWHLEVLHKSNTKKEL